MTVRSAREPTTTELVNELLRSVRATVAVQDPRCADILIRTKIERSATLQVVANERGLTRERIRQLGKELMVALDTRCDRQAQSVAQLVREELSTISSASVVEQLLDAVFDAAHPRLEHSMAVRTIARYVASKRLDLRSRGSFLVTSETDVLLDGLARLANTEADDVGIVDIGGIVARTAPGLLPHFDAVVDVLGLVRIGNCWVLRNTKRARAKVFIRELGRPASSAEIARLLGLRPARVSGVLRQTKSILRAGERTWGLAEWVEEEYEGIPAAVRRRIAEHGGAVALDLLLADIPARFGVTEASVRVCVRTAQFQVTDGVVRMAGR